MCVCISPAQRRVAPPHPQPRLEETDRNSALSRRSAFGSLSNTRDPLYTVRTYYHTPCPGRCVRPHLPLLAPATMGLHGVVLLMDMYQWTTHVRKANMDMDHTVYIRCGLASMDERWKLDRLCCEAAVVDTYDGSRTGALCHVLKNRRSPDERGQR